MPAGALPRSHLLTGTVRHRRRRHADYDFTHRVWYFAIDLDELDEVDARLRTFSVNRRNLLELRDADHLHPGHPGIRATIDARITALGLDPARLIITLITYPRVAGYVFNPVSFYLCHEQTGGTRSGALRVVIAEVHNTHCDREVYDFLPTRSEDDARVFHGRQEKQMYVSPFIGAEAQYNLRVWEGEDTLAISITEDEPSGPTLYAGVRLHARPLTERNVLRLLARDPMVPLKTSVLIFIHAIRLWAKRVPWHRYRRSASTSSRIDRAP
jgi:uncharacterized protein